MTDVFVAQAVAIASRSVNNVSTSASPKIRVAWTPSPGTPNRFA